MDFVYIYNWNDQDLIIGFANFNFRLKFTFIMEDDGRKEAALRNSFARAAVAMRDLDRVYRDMGWGTLIPKTPAAPVPFATPVVSAPPGPRLGSSRAATGMAGITPVHGSVTISGSEFERFCRFKAMEAMERDMERNRGGQDAGSGQDRARGQDRDRSHDRERRQDRERGHDMVTGRGEDDNNRGGEREREVRGRRDHDTNRGGEREREVRGRRDHNTHRGGEREKERRNKDSGTRKLDGGSNWDEKRRLGGRCGKCGDIHPTRKCRRRKEDLKCDYPPCTNKTGHLSIVCHELMKRCRMPVCKNARGHRTSSHYSPENVLPYGDDARAARELRRIFEEFKTCLSGEELKIISRYEEKNRSSRDNTDKEKKDYWAESMS